MRRLLALLAAVVAVITARPAFAAPDPLGLSWDGVTWSDSLTGSLFEGAGPWVPGDSATDRFYVRDRSTDAASLRVDYDLPSSPLLGPDDLTVSARVDSGPWVALAGGGGWVPLASGTLPSQGTTTVEVQASFNPVSGNSSQELSAALTFRVTLSGDSLIAATGSNAPTTVVANAAPTGEQARSSSAASGGSSAGGLSFTGAAALPLLIAAGALLAGAGLGVLGGVRRRRGGDHV